MDTRLQDARGKLGHALGDHEAPHWLVVLAKIGYASRGFVYILIGSLALMQALGMGGGETSDSKEALGGLMQAPGGVVLLGLMSLGLIGYSIWRFCQSVLDADDHGDDAKGLAIRGGLLISSFTHAGLAIYAAQVATRNASSSGGSGESSEGMVARILQWPGGAWIVGAIGLGIIGAGVAHGIKAVKEKYRKRFDADPDTMRVLNPICKYGLFARGVAFGIIGGLLIYAAVTHNPEEAAGLREVLDQISQQVFGKTLLGIMAVGLVSFGLYSIFESIYRRISGPT